MAAATFDLLRQPMMLIGDPENAPPRRLMSVWAPDATMRALELLGYASGVLKQDTAPSINTTGAAQMWFQRDQTTTPLPDRGTNGPGAFFIDLGDGTGWHSANDTLLGAYLIAKGGGARATAVAAEAAVARAAEAALAARITPLESAIGTPERADHSVVSRAITTPPATPAAGDRYIVAIGGTSFWAGHDGQIATWTAGAWAYHVIAEGELIWLDDENILVSYDGTTLVPVITKPPVLASQAQVDAGTDAVTYVSPLTLKSRALAASDARAMVDAIQADAGTGGALLDLLTSVPGSALLDGTSVGSYLFTMSSTQAGDAFAPRDPATYGNPGTWAARGNVSGNIAHPTITGAFAPMIWRRVL